MSDERNIVFYLIRVSIVVGITTVFGCALTLASWRHSQQRSQAVTVYAFSDMLSSEVFESFTQKTGIEVTVRHFETVEEIVTKLLFTKNNDIDLVVPSDSMVEIFRKEGLLQSIDRTLLKHWHEVDTRLLGRFFDPDNTYSVPLSWSPLGIGYDTRVITTPRDRVGWDLIFGKVDKAGIHPPADTYGDQVDRVCLGEDLWESLFLQRFTFLVHLKKLHRFSSRLLPSCSAGKKSGLSAILII